VIAAFSAPPFVAFASLALVIGALLAALLVSRIRSLGFGRIAGWGLVLGGFIAIERVCRDAPAGFRMLAICGVVLFAMKGIVSVEDAADRGSRLSVGRWLVFGALWPGMRPALFETTIPPDGPGARALLVRGASRLLLGALLLFAASVVSREANGTAALVAATALALPGVSLVLHFGLFTLGAAMFRALGIDASLLFDHPLLSRSLAEFWGRRWNIAFTEMTQRAVYRPLHPMIGKPAATAAAFAFSALLHELAISVPVRAGFGLPLAYFAIHGALVIIEKRLARSGRPIDRHPRFGRAWTLAWLVLPMPILFHPAFLRGVVWPLIGRV
jgi:alginate O-acetyltransferase complex protein AlgI